MIIRILHVVSIMDRGGQEALIMNLYRNLNREEIQFDILCTLHEKGDFDDEILKLGGRIYHLPSNSIKVRHLSNIETVFLYASFFKQHPEFKIVHIHNYHAYSTLIEVIGAKIANVQNVIVHSHNTSAPHAVIHKLARPILNCFKFIRFACSEDAARWMFGNHFENVTLLKNGINPNLFLYNSTDRNLLRKQLNLFNKRVILHIGRFDYQKNHKYLLCLFEQIHLVDSSTHLLLVGRGELEVYAKKWVLDHNLEESVSFLGIREDIPALFNASDLFLFPSLFEGLSVALVEAQASGINVLTTTNLAKETIFSDNLYQLSLELSVDIWVKKSLELMQNYNHEDKSRAVIDAGFDIRTLSKDLARIYISLIKCSQN